jgi:hypothetical protein
MIFQLILFLSAAFAMPVPPISIKSAGLGVKRKAGYIVEYGNHLAVAVKKPSHALNEILPETGFIEVSPHISKFFGQPQDRFPVLSKKKINSGLKTLKMLKEERLDNLKFFRDIRDFEMKISPEDRIFNNDVYQEIQKMEDYIKFYQMMIDEINAMPWVRS